MVLLGDGWPSLVPVSPKESPLLTWVSTYDAGRGSRVGGNVRVGGMVLRASVKSEGRVQGLRRGVGAAQAAEQSVIHRIRETTMAKKCPKERKICN